MYPTRSVQVHQQRRIRNRASNSDSYEFFNMLKVCAIRIRSL